MELMVDNKQEVSINALQVSDKETIAVLLCILEGVSRNMLSPDAWWLSLHSAKNMAINKLGLSEEIVNEVFERFEKTRKPLAKSNPMYDMF